MAAEEVPEGAEEVVAQEREARPVRQHEHSVMEEDLRGNYNFPFVVSDVNARYADMQKNTWARLRDSRT